MRTVDRHQRAMRTVDRHQRAMRTVDREQRSMRTVDREQRAMKTVDREKSSECKQVTGGLRAHYPGPATKFQIPAQLLCDMRLWSRAMLQGVF